MTAMDERILPLGDTIKQACSRHGISIYRLSALLGRSTSTIWPIITGRTPSVGSKRLERIVEATDHALVCLGPGRWAAIPCDQVAGMLKPIDDPAP